MRSFHGWTISKMSKSKFKGTAIYSQHLKLLHSRRYLKTSKHIILMKFRAENNVIDSLKNVPFPFSTINFFQKLQIRSVTGLKITVFVGS